MFLTVTGKRGEEINCEINPGFNHKEEMVIRKSEFMDGRTFGIKADKSASELDRELIGFLKKGKAVSVEILPI